MRACRGTGLYVGIGLAIAFAPAPTFAADTVPGPLGDETLVNQTTTGDQRMPQVARDADGDYVVVWAGNGPGDDSGIFARLHDASGTPKGAEFRVNSFTQNTQSEPAVAMDAAGDFVVVWSSDHVTAGNTEIFDRLYTADGSPVASTEFKSNTYGTNAQYHPAVAMDATGNYVVAWEGEGTGDALGIFAHRYTSAGTSASTDFRANTTTTGPQRAPAVARAASGAFVIVWSGDEGTDFSIYGQRYDAAGAAAGTEFKASTNLNSNEASPAVAIDAAGSNIIVTWGTDPITSDGKVYYTQFVNGVKQTPDIAVAKYTAIENDRAQAPDVAMDADGHFVISWSTREPSAGSFHVVAELHAPDRSLIGSNLYESVSQAAGFVQPFSAVSLDADGDFVLVWASTNQDGSGDGVYARRYAGPENIDLGMSMSDSPDPVARGGALTYSFGIHNYHGAPVLTGNSAQDQYFAKFGVATGITVILTLPDGMSGGSTTSPSWSCTGTSVLTCSLAAKFIDGSNAILDVDVTAPTSGGSKVAGAVVTGDQYDSNYSNDTGSETTQVTPPPDTTPDAFAFSDQTGVNPGATVTSAAVTIGGIEQPVAISVTGGTYSIGCTGAFTGSAGTIGNGQTVCVRHTAASSFGTASHTVLTAGGVSDTFTSTTRAADTTPDAFAFNDTTGVEPGATVTSNTVTVAGIEQPVAIAVTGGAYSIGCTGTFATSAGTIANGQAVCVRHTAAGTFSTAANTTLTIGGIADTFTSTTRPPDTTPDTFSFIDASGVPTNAAVVSNAVAIGGIETAVAISVTGGEYSIGCGGSFTASPGTIANGETVCVRHTSASANDTATNTVLTVGGVADTFTSTTAAAAPAAGGGGGGGALSPGLLLLLGLAARIRARATGSRKSCR